MTAALPATDRGADLAFTVELAERAGRLLTERFEKVERIDFKSAKDDIAVGIGMVFQNFMLADNFTVWENVVLGD